MSKVRYLEEISELLARQATLELCVPEDLKVYLEKLPTATRKDNSEFSFEEHVGVLIAQELHDDSYEELRVQVEQVEQRGKIIREQVARHIKGLLLNLLDTPEKSVEKWVEKGFGETEIAEKFFFKNIMGEAPPRHVRLCSDVGNYPSGPSNLTATIHGMCDEDLEVEAKHHGISKEELAVHLLHNYRDNERLRELGEQLYEVRDDLFHLGFELMEFVEHVILEQYPDKNSKIEVREWFNTFRHCKRDPIES